MLKRDWQSLDREDLTKFIKLVEPGVIQCGDHLYGFDQDGNNRALDALEPAEVHVEYILPDWVKEKYSQHTFKFDAALMIANNHFEQAVDYKNDSTEVSLKNFLCCFNRSGHIGRNWLVEELFIREWFNKDYCSKGFKIPRENFNVKMHNFRNFKIIHGDPSNHSDFISNLKTLSPLIAESFFMLVSETVPDSYVVFPTEKFLFPTLNKRLWVAYAQPGYHKFLSETLGFRLYDDFFDYSFDTITDPRTRLSALLDSMEPYSKLTKKAWHSIYKAVEPVIEYNYHWATSGQFIDRLAALDEVTNPASIAESV